MHEYARNNPGANHGRLLYVYRFMTEGDDRYRMVEDELLRVAQRFTAHLHRAEYERLKRLATSQNAESIREIERPVIGTPTMEARRRHDRVAQRIKQRSIPGEDNDASSPRSTTGLRNLLDAPSLQEQSISSLAPRPSASARTSNLATTQHRRHTAAVQSSPGVGPSSSRISPFATPIRRRMPGHSSNQPSPATPGPSSTRPAVVNLVDDDIDLDDPFGLKKRNVKRKASREQFTSRTPKKEPSAVGSVVPHFL